MPTSIRSLARALAAVVAPLIIIVANNAEAAAGNTPPPFVGMGCRRGHRRRAPLFAATTSMRRRIAAAVEGDAILSFPRGGDGEDEGEGEDDGGEHNDDDDDADRGVRGGNISPSTTTTTSSSSSWREEGGGAWEEEIRRAREFYAAASSSSPSLPLSETILVADVDDIDDVDADDDDADDVDADDIDDVDADDAGAANANDADADVDVDDAVANPDTDDVDANADADAYDAYANADADDADADDAHTTTDNAAEDGRVFGNYQTAVASHDVRGDRGEIMEEEREQVHEPSEEESMPGSEAVGDDVTSSARGETGGATDASENEQDGAISMIRASAVDAPSGKDDDGVYAQDGDGIAHEEGLKGEEATLVASLESDPEEGSYDVDEGAGGLVAAEELSLDEEYSDKIAVGMNDVATAISEEVVVQDKNVDSANVGHHVEDNNQEVSHVSDIALKEADLLLPQRWERASRATASNKLVEEGLHRLQRRDAVVEETSGDKSFKEAVLKLIHMIRKRVSTSFASRHTKKVMPIILTSLGLGYRCSSPPIMPTESHPTELCKLMSSNPLIMLHKIIRTSRCRAPKN